MEKLGGGGIPGRRKGMIKSARVLKEHDIFKAWHRTPGDYRIKDKRGKQGEMRRKKVVNLMKNTTT